MFLLKMLALIALTATTPTTPMSGDTGPRLIVYYFHGDFRCENCLAIEAAAAAALRGHYAEQLATGAFVWRALNVQAPEHEHFAAQFHLASQALILVDPRSGEPPRWQDLDWIWNLVGDDDAFTAQLAHDIDAFMAAAAKTDEG